MLPMYPANLSLKKPTILCQLKKNTKSIENNVKNLFSTVLFNKNALIFSCASIFKKYIFIVLNGENDRTHILNESNETQEI